MKIAVLGASGHYGAKIAGILATHEGVETVTLAARNAAKLEGVAAGIGSKATTAQVDLSQADVLRNFFGEQDLVVDCIGRYYDRLHQSVTAAIDAGTHYVDLSEMWDVAEHIHALNDKAREAGVTVYHGMGSTPGVTSMLAVLAGNELENTTAVHAGFVVATAAYFPDPEAFQLLERDGSISAVQDTIIELVAEKAKVLKAGELIVVDPMRDGPRLTFPGGASTPVFPVGMSLPLTLPTVLSGLQEVSTCMAFLPDRVINTLLEQGAAVNRGESNRNEAFHDTCADVSTHWQESTVIPEGLPGYAQWGLAFGERGGERTSCNLILNRPLGTEYGAAAAAVALAEGQQQPGVFSVEQAFEPMDFLNRIAELQYGEQLGAEDLTRHFA